uniref:Rhodanese domain-containing protein n=1 Tax=Globisporangium ultimum (strain ATCC 200006 / CBS 805.95 / DAOM BR144) TaxID=431595 RepID=K3XA00_GLOUD
MTTEACAHEPLPLQREQRDNNAIVNSSAYGFCVFKASDLLALKTRLLDRATKWSGVDNNEQQLRGTILLSEEGVNIRLSGTRGSVEAMKAELRGLHPDLSSMEFKDSMSSRLTLPRMLVKVKKEVISMGVDEVRPAKDGLAAHISAEDFKQWLDEDKDMVVLDTRNDYEVRLGTFDKAVDLNIKSFRAFPSEVKAQLRDVPKEKPIVMFCTGGVRCEKASYVLLQDGHQQVYQLDGGILKYFEKVGGAHYNGDCYIFDDRVALRSNLSEGSAIACFVCRSPLSEHDQCSPDYIPEMQCSYCKHGKSDFRHRQ